MGISSDGLLFFGFDFHDSEDAGGDPFDGEWETEYCKRKGLVDDSGLYDNHGGYCFPPGAERNAQEAKHDLYLDKRRALLKDATCAIDMHCSFDYPIYFVHLKGKMASASRGFPHKFEKDFMEVTPEQIQQMKEFCEFMEIEYKGPTWVLASLYG